MLCLCFFEEIFENLRLYTQSTVRGKYPEAILNPGIILIYLGESLGELN